MKSYALLHAFAAAASLLVVLGLIGLGNLTNPHAMMELAQQKPWVLYMQDFLKCLMAWATFQMASRFSLKTDIQVKHLGALSAIILVSNAFLSMYAVAFSKSGLSVAIHSLGFSALVFNAIYMVYLNLRLKKQNLIPTWLAHVGIAAGLCSLPMVSLLSLLGTVIWCVGISRNTQ